MRYGHIISFLVKWLATIAAVLFVGLFFPLFGVLNWFHVIVLGTVITIVGYIADLTVPRRSNHIVAIAGDFAVAALIMYVGNLIFPGMRITWTFAILTGLLVAGVEIFYHAKLVSRQGCA